MKAAYIKAPYQVQIRDVTLKEVGEDDVRIRVKACGICGTDVTSVSVSAEEWEPVGHEIAGVVEQVGDRVTHTKVGDTVTLETGTYCRTCNNCRNGRYDLCNIGPHFWLKGPMGFAEQIVVPKECVVPYTDLSFEHASLTEPLGVALDLAYTVDIQLNDDVLVVGLGPIGLMAVRLAKLMGARKVYAASRSGSTKRNEVARLFGADEIIYTDQQSLVDYQASCGGFDRILVTAPPKTIPAAMRIANVGGVIGFVGIEYGAGASISFDANDFHFRKLQLRASHASPALYFPRCIELLKSGAIDAKALITHTFPLDKLEEAFQTLKEDKGTTIKLVMVNP